MFIAVEGIDGAGTTTLSKNLATVLENLNFKTYITMEPSTLTIGKIIRKELKTPRAQSGERMALLFAADRVEHFYTEIEHSYAQEKSVVISDRYKLSSMAYQGALGVELDWLFEINSIVPWPDLTIFLRIDPQIAMKRISKRPQKDTYEKLEFQKQVANMYEKLLNRYCFKHIVLDATLDPQELTQQALKEIIHALKDLSYIEY